MTTQVVPLTREDLPNILELVPLLLDANSQKTAEHRIVEFSKRPGFCTLLLEIIANKMLSEQFRSVVVILLKNSVENYWNSRRGIIVISEGEKKLYSECVAFSY
jgi:hypothetical protein